MARPVHNPSVQKIKRDSLDCESRSVGKFAPEISLLGTVLSRYSSGVAMLNSPISSWRNQLISPRQNFPDYHREPSGGKRL